MKRKKSMKAVCDICWSEFLYTSENWNIGQGWTLNMTGILVCQEAICLRKATVIHSKVLWNLAPNEEFMTKNGWKIAWPKNV